MAQTRHNPHFQLFPLNNARTGYQAFPMPIIYIEPDRVDANGSGILNSEATSLRYYIAEAPGPAKVAGPFNRNLLVPNVALFEVQVSRQQLADRQILVSGMPFFNAAGESIAFEDADEGDFFQYTLESNGIVDKVPYYKDAYYYDLSTISIDVDTLPSNRYLFIWESIYYARLLTFSGSFKCVSDTVGRSLQVLEVNHPGEVHQSYFKFTPGLYFDYENFELASDPTLQFYRPFADVLQDIYDEQSLLDGINHIDSIPAQYIPYLAYLIGWDIPNFPGASDTLRRQILRKAVYLQKLKGSRRAIIELFEIFGYTIDLINLWASKDGNKFLGPNDGIPTTVETQVDACVLDYSASGFGIDGEIPLTFSPMRDSQLVLHAYLVNSGAALDALTEIKTALSSDLTAYNDEIPVHDINGLLVPLKLTSAIPLDSTVLSHSTVKVGTIDTLGDSYNTGITTAIKSTGVTYDKYKNVLKVNFDHELSVDPNAKLFIFAAYERQILDLGELSNTRSNRFDVEIISALTDKLPDFELFMFLLNFLFKLKAFHSILRKIKFTVNTIDVYNVTDFCVDGKDEFAQCSTVGEFQVPPAVIPTTPELCEDDNNRGFKQADFDMRKLILDGLEEEFQGWKALAPDCALTPVGQDKVLSDVDIGCGVSSGTDFDHNPDTRPTYCEPLDSKPDYCYKGRVEADLSFSIVIPLDEYVKNIPCGPNMGNGVFWLNSNDQLNFSDAQYFDFAYPTLNWLVYKPQSLQLEKDNLGFPGHRFLTMNRLEYEAVIDGYKRRPLDENLVCGTFSNVLNASMVHPGELSVIVAINGSQFDVRDYVYNDLIQAGFATLADALAYIDASGFFIAEHLTFDDANLSYHPNGLVSDIPSLSDHGVTVDDGRILTHNVQQVTLPQVVVVDGVTYYPIVDDFDYSGVNTDGSIINKITSDDTIVGPIFDSACINSSGFIDFAGGYPSSYNLVPIPADHLDYRFSDAADTTDMSIDRAALATYFGIDTWPVQTQARYFGQTMLLLEKTDAQYKFYVPYRLDCNCLYAEVYQNGCEVTSGLAPVQCNSSALYDSNGLYDPSPDKIEIDIAAVHTEEFSTCNRVSNYDLPNLFCVNEDCSLATSGSFKYKDAYNIIYESFWVANEDTIDLTTIVKDPRLPGMEDEGYVDAAGRVFRKGIITATRQIIKLTASGSYVDSEGVEIIIDFFQDNTVCCDTPFADPFAYKVNCGILDEVSLLITSGPRWVDPLESPDVTGLTFVAAAAGCSGSTYWADVSECNVSVDQPFIMTWTDPMGNGLPPHEPDPCKIDYVEPGCDASSSSSSQSTQTTASTQSDDPSSPSSLSSNSSQSSPTSASTSSSSSSTSSTSSSDSSESSSTSSSDSLSSISSMSSDSTATSETSTSSTNSSSSDSSTLSESTEIRSTQSTQTSNSSDSSLSSFSTDSSISSSSHSSSSSTISSLSTRTSRSSQSSSVSSTDSGNNTSHTTSATDSTQSPITFTNSSPSSISSANSSHSSQSLSTSSSTDSSAGNESVSSLSEYEPMAMIVETIDSLAIDSVVPQSVPIGISVSPIPPNIAGWSYYASIHNSEGNPAVSLSGDVSGTFDDSTVGSKTIDLVVDYHWFTADDGFNKNVIVRINRAIPTNPNHDHYVHDHIDLIVQVSIIDLANVIMLDEQSSSSSSSVSSDSSGTVSSLSTISQSLSSISLSTSSSSMEYLTSSTGSSSTSSTSSRSLSSLSTGSTSSSSTSSSSTSRTFSSDSSSDSSLSSSSSTKSSSSTSSRTPSSLSTNSSSSQSSFSFASISSQSLSSSSSTLFRSSNSSSSSKSLSTSSSSYQGDLPFDPNSITFNGCVNDVAYQGSYFDPALPQLAFVVGEFDTVNALNGTFTRRGACAINMTNGHVTSWNPDLKTGSDPGVGLCLYTIAGSNQETGGLNSSIIYIGGSFTSASGSARSNAAAYDQYGNLLLWNPSPNGPVNDMDSFGLNIFIGGAFTQCVSTTRRYFASVTRIDLYHGGVIAGYGVLQALDLDADNQVLVVYADVSAQIVYVGGDFTAVKTTTAPVSRGYGASINIVSAGTVQTWDPQANSRIRAIAIDASPLREIVVVGGEFSTLRGSSRVGIGSFTRGTNTLKTYGPAISDGYVAALAFAGSNTLFVAGTFTSITQNDFYSIATAGPYGAAILDDSLGIALIEGDTWPHDPFTSPVYCGVNFNASYEYGVFGYCNALYFRAPPFETNVSSASSSSTSSSSNTVTSSTSTSSTSTSSTSNTQSSSSSSSTETSSSSSKSLSSNTDSTSSKSTESSSSSSSLTSGSSNTRSSQSSSSSSNTPSSASSPSSFSSSSDSNSSSSSSSRTPSSESSSSELAPTAGVTTNSNIAGDVLVGNKLFVYGSFTTVTDTSGTVARTGLACLDLDAGLWTSWNPVNSGGLVMSIASDGISIYVFQSGGTLNGQSTFNPGTMVKLDTTTGTTNDPVFTSPVLSGSTIINMRYSAGLIYMSGSFTAINGSTRTGNAAIASSDGTLNSWRPGNGDTAFVTQPCTVDVDKNGKILLSNAFLLRPDGIGSMAYGIGAFDPVTGLAEQMLMGPAAGHVAARSSNVMVVGGSFATEYSMLAPLYGPAFAANSYYIMMTDHSGETLKRIYGNTFIGGLVDYPRAIHIDSDDNVYISLPGTSIDADTSRNGVAKLSGVDGSVITSFTMAWASGAIVRSITQYGNKLILTGSWTSLVNGQSRNNICVVDKDTGALVL